MEEEQQQQQQEFTEHLPTNYFLDKINGVRAKLGQRKGPNVIWLREKEDETIVRPQEMDLSNGQNTMSRALADFEHGLAIITGLPNCGKTTLMINMQLQSLALNPDLIVADLSFDDPIDKRYQQWIASMTGLYYQDITTDTALSREKQALRADADKFLDDMILSERLHVYNEHDVYKDKNGRSVEVEFLKVGNIIKLMAQLRRRFPDKKIAMFVDAWNDLDLQIGRNDSEVQAAQRCARALKNKSQEYGVMLIMSAHLRKTMGRQAGLEDLKGSNYLSFAAVWVGIARNEFRENSMNDPLMYPVGNKQVAVLTLTPVKSKVSTWDMPIYYPLLSGQGSIITLTTDEYAMLRADHMASYHRKQQ